MPAPSTDVDLANMALACLGETIKITTLDGTENTPAAKAARDFIETSRQTLLEEFRWHFCEKRAVLTETTGSGAWWDAIGEAWSHVYTAPTGCLIAREIWPGSRAPTPDQAVPFDFVENAAGTGKVIVTDEPPGTNVPIVLYTPDTVSVTRCPQWFVRALAWALAADIAVPVTKKPEILKAAQAGRAFYVGRATVFDQAQGRRDPEPPTPSLAARGAVRWPHGQTR